MKRKTQTLSLTLAVLMLLATLFGNTAQPVVAATNDLFFSEYVEGSSNNKALAIYNSFTVQSAASCTTFTPIYAIQGAGTATTYDNTIDEETTRGVVTADFQGATNQNGFYIQDPIGDNDPTTSDGIFVYAPATTDVAVGDDLLVIGQADEFNTLTQITTVSSIIKCGSTTPPAPTPVELPETVNGELERFESMLVTFPETLTVSQNFFLGRYGQLTLSSEGRLYNPTNILQPKSPEATALADENARRLLVLDDARTAQNPNPIPYIGANGTVRAGDTTSGLTGVLDFGPISSNSSVRDYRLQPTVTPTFNSVNQRTTAPDPVGGNIKVASFNVLNYFTTIDQTGAACYPGGTRSDCRGADSQVEFERQRAKIVAALVAIDADVVGLIELENNGATAINDLVGALNAATAPDTYAAVADPETGVGDDAIKVALIYKPGRVVAAGPSYSSTDPIFDRLPVAQTFVLKQNGARFTAVVNHLKSKGSCPAAGDPNADQGDGQGCWNAKRVQQAQALLTFVDTLRNVSGDPDVLVMGDLNAYGKEDPIQTLANGGLIDQLAKRVQNPYSYIFDGQAGYLDHALTTGSLDPQVTGVTEWHINADEPSVIDYNTEFKPQDLYTATPYRSSDHDPVIIGMQLTPGVRKLYMPAMFSR